MRNQVYFDHNATTPLHDWVKAKVGDWLETWGNPSSIHWAGRAPKALVREARQNLAVALGVDALELVFTSGGSEANNLALKGLCPPLHAGPGVRDQILISAVEHPSVNQAADSLRRQGYSIGFIPVDRDGQLNWAEMDRLLGARTALVAVMLANNETGHIFPIQEVVRRAHKAGAWVHCDAVQGLGKLPLTPKIWGVDTMSLSGHKFYAFKGTGALYVRKGLNLSSLIHGGGQERGRRAGTENLLGIASLGLMSSHFSEIESQAARVAQLRDHLELRVTQALSGVVVTGPSTPRLANTSSLVIDGVDGETLLMNLDVLGFAVSTGAACSSGSAEPSPTLLSMGLSRAEAQSSLRVSLGWGNSLDEVDAFVEALVLVVNRLRSFKHGERFAYGV